MKFTYDKDFKPTQEYLDSMPDLQNGDLIKGSKAAIEKVGISNFRLPLKIKTQSGEPIELEVSVVGSVSLDAVSKGINMSRIIRSFYEFKDHIFSIEKLGDVLKAYQQKLGSFDAYIILSFNYRIWQESLRSVNSLGEKNGGWQYYKVSLEGSIDRQGDFKKQVHFDFVYSSACPCSTELSLHAMEGRDQYAIPHSQRSVARISLQFDEMIWIEEIQQLCQQALQTETLVFCKREDEQAFAEKNAANVKFVEDAVRLLKQSLDTDSRILDYKVIASHNESLHSHDAIAVITKEGGDYDPIITPSELKSLIY